MCSKFTRVDLLDHSSHNAPRYHWPLEDGIDGMASGDDDHPNFRGSRLIRVEIRNTSCTQPNSMLCQLFPNPQALKGTNFISFVTADRQTEMEMHRKRRQSRGEKERNEMWRKGDYSLQYMDGIITRVGEWEEVYNLWVQHIQLYLQETP